ncbi:unnamed protein product [Pieris macdunnoughi]|uniref:Uncharacterized protein n=1 Tax=Pieris macdunnoughi TaxID=345717 RepID=A0A821TLQ1_9NEOP|nr:unnamed protein product [Pieris macdunnoughi]
MKNGTVISVGTGQALNKHLDYQLLSKGLAKDTSGTSWKNKFNKILDSATDTEDTNAYIRRNQHKFEQAAAMLVRKRTVAQRVFDFVEHRAQLMGISQAN